MKMSPSQRLSAPTLTPTQPASEICHTLGSHCRSTCYATFKANLASAAALQGSKGVTVLACHVMLRHHMQNVSCTLAVAAHPMNSPMNS
jgi:hypothetical protein